MPKHSGWSYATGLKPDGSLKGWLRKFLQIRRRQAWKHEADLELRIQHGGSAMIGSNPILFEIELGETGLTAKGSAVPFTDVDLSGLPTVELDDFDEE